MVASSSTPYQPNPLEACKNPTEAGRSSGLAKGVLELPRGVEHGRLLPAPDVSEFVEHYWWVLYSVDAPRFSEVLSYPSIHVVFERHAELKSDRYASFSAEHGPGQIVGIVRKKFVRELTGRGEVFGIKFRPAMFQCLNHVPACDLTDRVLPLTDELGDADLTSAIWRVRSLPERAEFVERILTGVLPEPPPKARLVRDLVECVRAEPWLGSVAVLAKTSGLSERTLERLFREFLGVTPKWVIRRFRLQEATELLRQSHRTIASVAAGLGYFDQAHFARDFKAVVGKSPIEFLREQRHPRKTQ